MERKIIKIDNEYWICEKVSPNDRRGEIEHAGSKWRKIEKTNLQNNG